MFFFPVSTPVGRSRSEGRYDNRRPLLLLLLLLQLKIRMDDAARQSERYRVEIKLDGGKECQWAVLYIFPLHHYNHPPSSSHHITRHSRAHTRNNMRPSSAAQRSAARKQRDSISSASPADSLSISLVLTNTEETCSA